MKTVTIDLSQLSLAEGTHIMTAIARASGYAPSAPSAPVTYIVDTWEYPEADGDDLIIRQAYDVTADGDDLIIE